MIDEKDASLRTDVLLMSVWIDHLLAGEEKESKHAKAPRKAPNFHAIREMHDLPIEDIKANTECRRFLLKPLANSDEAVYSLATGRTIAAAAWKRASNYRVERVQVPYGHADELCQTVAHMIKTASLSCKFERIRDMYMHQLLRGKLCPARLASLPWTPSSPFEELPKQYTGMATNELIRPFIETAAHTVCCAVDWPKISTVEVFVLTFSILQELCDHVSEVPILNSSEIPYHVQKPFPCPIVIHPDFCLPDVGASSYFGFVHDETIFVSEKSTEYPIPALILCWLEKSLEVIPVDEPVGKTLRELHTAILEPDSLSPASYLYRMFHKTEDSDKAKRDP